MHQMHQGAFKARPHNESKWCRKRASRSPARSASPARGLGRRPKKTGERRMKRTGDRVRHVSEESEAPTSEDRTPRRRRTSTSRSTRHRKTSRPRMVPRRWRRHTPVLVKGDSETPRTGDSYTETEDDGKESVRLVRWDSGSGS